MWWFNLERYTPGAWIEEVGGMTLSDYVVPKTTTLLVIGPKGSGKSSLINRISKVFENHAFTSARAQESCKIYFIYLSFFPYLQKLSC